MIGDALKFSRYMFALLIGLCVAALYVQIVRPLQSDFASAFRPPPYWDHPRLGPVFGPPNYRGFMQIPGGGSTRVELDAFGLQPESQNSSGKGPLILVLGGASQTFGFGLSRGKSIPERIAPNLCGPARVRSTALPGHSIADGWLRYLATRQDQNSLDIVVITSFDTRNFLSLAGIPGDDIDFTKFDIATYNAKLLSALGVTEFGVPPGLAMKFEFYEGLRQGVIGRWLTALYADNIGMKTKSTLVLGPNEFIGLDHYKAFLEMLLRNSKVLVVGYPLRTPDEPYARLEAATPPNVPFLNLHNRAKAENIELDWFPDGHYREVSSDTIGRLIAEQICDQGWVGGTK